jgi:Serine-threonine protein kinase 19
MPLRITSAPVSGIQKRKAATSTRNRASPFASHARAKPPTGSNAQSAKLQQSGADEVLAYDGGDSEPLPDLGGSQYLTESVKLDGVLQAMQHAKESMFEELPARAGMNSTRIAEVLNLRRSLPPLVSVAHVHTVLQAPTKVEREIVSLVQTGQLRRLIVPGRGNNAAGLGDCLVLADDLHGLVQASELEQSLKGLSFFFFLFLFINTRLTEYLDRFLHTLDHMANTSAIPSLAFSREESVALVRAGFLVTASSLSQDAVNLTSLRAYPSTNDDINTRLNSPQSRAPAFFLSLPNTGPYLRLLGSARSHLLALLKQSKYHEAPLYLLRDRWDGAVESTRSFSMAKRARGEFSGVLPGRTKKWKEFNGMSFRWILEEALGAGLMEIFATGSVGPGVRCL